MRKAILFLLIPLVLFGVDLRVGREVLFSSQSGMLSFDNIVLIIQAISELLEYPPPKIVSNENFTALEFNDKVIGYDGKSMILGEGKPQTEFLTPKEFLEFFYIPYVYESNSYIVPECMILNLRKIGGSLEVTYVGNPAFIYRMSGDSLVILSTGYVFYSGEIYGPGETISRFRVRGYEIGKVLEGEGKDVVKLVKAGEGKKILMFPYGSSLIKPLSPLGLGVILAKGKGSVIVRPPAPELKGLDIESFENGKKIGESLARKLGYTFEICPVVGVPPGSTYLLVLLKSENDWKNLAEILRELSGIEKTIDYTDTFDSLPVLEH